ncbi:hypothetical protein [Burkholderia sp. Bp9143]|uniref:hypothetical protein n=1 Tax=Burkholderia sp. Bp9143 TaxID=2184574 RepID=UPI00162465F6|nr:hypothetical protein [Burkholderia sp. Bp9143]
MPAGTDAAFSMAVPSQYITTTVVAMIDVNVAVTATKLATFRRRLAAAMLSLLQGPKWF